MIDKLCLYKKKVYKVHLDNELLILSSSEVSDKVKNGFTDYVDVLGRSHSNFFENKVTIDEVEIVYELQINAIYKGKEFETYAVGSFCLLESHILLFSNVSKDIEEYGFVKEEQFVFKKEISLDEVEALVEIKKPILKFKGMTNSKRLIPNDSILEYIRNLD